MKISTDSITYRKYARALEELGEFWDDYRSPREVESFCRMMRIIYVWRPLAVTFRLASMLMATMLPLVALAFTPAAFGVGLTALVGLALTIFCFCIGLDFLDTWNKERRIRRQFDFSNPSSSSLPTWARAIRQRVCPLVEFVQPTPGENHE